MNRLKHKVFCTIYILFTLFLLVFILIFNVQLYNQEKHQILNSLDRMNNDKFRNNKIENKEPEHFIFMDQDIYNIILDNSNNIQEIVNHSDKGISTNKIKKIADSILKKSKTNKRYIGILYFNNYSYNYLSGERLIIMDNANTKRRLNSYLMTSIIIFVILELIAFIITKIITNWITDPVKKSFEKQKQFIEDASHELKTPLSVIVSSSEALESEIGKQKWLNNIQNESERMNKLITDLLDLANLEYQQNKIYEEGNLSKIVELSILTFEGKMFEKNLQLKYKIDDNILLKVDENSIKQLIEILLDNAIKHSKKNTQIEVNLLKGKDIILEVINYGSEIPIGEEDKIFERFYRVDKSRNRKENRYGLGLAIAKNIVINHNGIIGVESKNNKTKFKVVFKK